MDPITLGTIYTLIKSPQAQQLIKMILPMLGGSGGVKQMIGDQAGAFAQIIAVNMQTDYRVITQEKFDMLKAQLDDAAMEKVSLACEVPDEQELFNAMLIVWLLMVNEKFDKD